jgi:hypothetical protein
MNLIKRRLKMKCSLCNNYHDFGEPCIHGDSPLFNFNARLRADPIIPSYEPPKFEFNNFIKPDPIIQPYEAHRLDFNIKPDPILPSYEPPKFDFNIKPDPILPSCEPSKFEFNIKPDPILPRPPDPVYDISRNLVGWKSDLENTIRTTSGSTLNVEPGGFVRDSLNNLVGQMGPLNTMSPPIFPEMPDYGPPQSDMEAWDPGYSPLDPF